MEKGLTQRELAERLHVSDRTVSKWERGAGFPDVSILERLAAALELNVLDLLRGERTEERDVEAALKEAMEAFRQQRRRERGKLLKESVPTLLLLLVIAAFWLNLNPPTTKKTTRLSPPGSIKAGCWWPTPRWSFRAR